MDNLTEHRDLYKQALKNQDLAAIRREKSWLTTAATTALLAQDTEALQAVRACCADLPGLADHFDTTSKPGDRWRTLGEVLTLALDSGKPLQQLRLVSPNTVSGLMIRHIAQQAGISPAELAEQCGIEPNSLAEQLAKLDEAGLIYRLTREDREELYLSVLGRESLAV